MSQSQLDGCYQNVSIYYSYKGMFPNNYFNDNGKQYLIMGLSSLSLYYPYDSPNNGNWFIYKDG